MHESSLWPCNMLVQWVVQCGCTVGCTVWLYGGLYSLVVHCFYSGLYSVSEKWVAPFGSQCILEQVYIHTYVLRAKINMSDCRSSHSVRVGNAIVAVISL